MKSLSIEALAEGVERGERAFLARALTLVESSRPADHRRATELLERLLPRTGRATRVGITGVPGVGKSTFLESLGTRLADAGERVAVLAIDPSSAASGGSILGDKTRMPRLAVHERAFVRPSPSGGFLGGVARATREAILLCEAAGYSVIFVETVGVGQSEALVASMVDTVLLLLLPGAGDELQGIKRGILEQIDVVAVNKADGGQELAAQQARVEYESGLKLIRPALAAWQPPVLLCSGQTGMGLEAVWQKIQEHRRLLESAGLLAGRRQHQALGWLWAEIEQQLLWAFRQQPGMAGRLAAAEADIVAGRALPSRLASALVELFAPQIVDPDR